MVEVVIPATSSKLTLESRTELILCHLCETAGFKQAIWIRQRFKDGGKITHEKAAAISR